VVEVEQAKPSKQRSSKIWSSYCLISTTSRKSYIGATVDPHRRLRQHNGEIVGGARITRGGRPWIRVCHFHGFPNERCALQFEWKWKHLSTHGSRRKKKAPTAPIYQTWSKSLGMKLGHSALKRRLLALLHLVHLPQYTNSAPPARSIPLTLFWEDASRTHLGKIIEGFLPSHVTIAYV